MVCTVQGDGIIMDIKENEVYKKLLEKLDEMNCEVIEDENPNTAREYDGKIKLVLKLHKYSAILARLIITDDEGLKFSIWIVVETQSFMFDGDRSDINDFISSLMSIISRSVEGYFVTMLDDGEVTSHSPTKILSRIVFLKENSLIESNFDELAIETIMKILSLI